MTGCRYRSARRAGRPGDVWAPMKAEPVTGPDGPLLNKGGISCQRAAHTLQPESPPTHRRPARDPFTDRNSPSEKPEPHTEARDGLKRAVPPDVTFTCQPRGYGREGQHVWIYGGVKPKRNKMSWSAEEAAVNK